MQNKLTVTNGRQLTFSLGCDVSTKGIVWLREPTLDELNADDYLVQRCDESAGWWMGDVIVKRWKIEGAGVSLGRYAETYAQARGLNEQTVAHRAEVAEFYPVEVRYERPVSWSHHYIVMGYFSADGLHECLRWLERARAGGWNTGKLRQEICRQREADRDLREPRLPRSELDDAAQFESWASSMIGQIGSFDRERAARLLDWLKCTAALIEALKQKAGKESFTPTPLRR